MESIIQLPDEFVTSTTAYMAQLLTDLSPYIQLVLGIMLAAVVISLLIKAITK